MPNNTKPCKRKAGIDREAKQALADLKKVTAQHPDLILELKSVKDSLETIKSDPHHPK